VSLLSRYWASACSRECFDSDAAGPHSWAFLIVWLCSDRHPRHSGDSFRPMCSTGPERGVGVYVRYFGSVTSYLDVYSLGESVFSLVPPLILILFCTFATTMVDTSDEFGMNCPWACCRIAKHTGRT
jgi:hypothetical protein